MSIAKRSNPVEGHTGSGTSVATTAFGTNPVTGDTLVVFEITGGVVTHQAPTDTASNTYTQIGTTIGGGPLISMWRKENCSGGSSFVVTGHVNTATQVTVIAWCLSGASIPTSYNGDTAAATASTANPASGSSSPAPAANSFFIAGVADGGANNAVTAGSGWEFVTGSIQGDNTSFQSGYTEELTTPNTSSSAQNGQFTAIANPWAAGVASFAPDAGVSAGTVGGVPQMWHPGKGIINAARFKSTNQSNQISAGPQSYTLIADLGIYSVTGSAAGLKRGLVAGATTGTYVITGTNQTLHLNRSLPAGVGAGSYVITGSPTTLNEGHKLQAVAGSYVITGANAGIGTGLRVGAGGGTYILTGTAAALKTAHTFSALSGTYLISGATAAFQLSHKVGATAGAYIINGSTVNFIKTGGYRLVVDSGTYTITGSTITLKSGRTVTAGAGAYLLTGSPAKASFDVFPPGTGEGGTGKGITLGFTNHIRID